MRRSRLPRRFAIATALAVLIALLTPVAGAQAAAAPVVGRLTAPSYVRIFAVAQMTATFKDGSSGAGAPRKLVTIQRWVGTAWRPLASGVTNSAGIARFGIRWTGTGTRYRVVRAGDAATLTAISNTVVSRTRAFWQRVLVGTSYKGRSIWAYQIGTPGAPHRMLVLGGLHGDEPAGIKIVQDLLARQVPSNTDLWVIAHANPDGVAAHTRGNARGVDLNRNFPYLWHARPKGSLWSGPYGGSERETRALMAFITKLRPQTTVSWHQQRIGPMVDTTNGNNLTASTLATTLGYRKVYMGRTGGHLTDWIQHILGRNVHATTVEHPKSVSAAKIHASGTACLRVAVARQAAFD